MIIKKIKGKIKIGIAVYALRDFGQKDCCKRCNLFDTCLDFSKKFNSNICNKFSIGSRYNFKLDHYDTKEIS